MYSVNCGILTLRLSLIHILEGGTYVKEAKIGRAVMDADVVISLNHFKGHEAAGFGGAIKNIGMGCGSRAGKMEMHSAGKPRVSLRKCIGCGQCTKVCAHDAISITDKKAAIDHNKCVGCGRCIGAVSYTHLDVYKRQDLHHGGCGRRAGAFCRLRL